jgi:hypothetical protein
MKNPVLGLFILAAPLILFSACETKYYAVTVQNNTAKTISYTYDDRAETLNPWEAREHQIRPYAPPPKDAADGNGIKSVKVEALASGEAYSIVDVPPIPLEVSKSLAVDVRITAGGYIEHSGNPFIEMPATSTSVSATIYTEHPVFESSPKYEGQPDLDSYPVTFEWELVVDKNNPPNKTMFVTVR